MVVVGLCGAIGSGKDAAAWGLVQRGFERIAFADGLRVWLYLVDPAIRSLVDRLGWETAKREHRSVREALQREGMRFRETVGADVWIRVVWGQLRDGHRYVIPDVRFSNEVKAIRDCGGMIVRIIRPGKEEEDDHVSEHGLEADEWDAEVVNDGTVEQLWEKMLQVAGI